MDGAAVGLAPGAEIVKSTGRHGEIRGLSLSRRSPQFEGRFGRMFRTLLAAKFEAGMLKDLADGMTAAADVATPETEIDDEENTGISAGYTYLGQFIDHDLTFDPVSSLQRQNDPDGLTDYRTPRFDLDNVYGRGPDDQPYLYRKDGRRMVLGDVMTGNDQDPNARGVPRLHGQDGEPDRAVIGDPRNDENVIVSQLQASMLRFHNRMAQELGPSAEFEEIQQSVRWHYQYVVLHDFLPTVCGERVMDDIFGEVKPGETATAKPPQLRFYKIEHEAFIPIEFTVGAYRFGHSMVRPIYRLNATADRLPIFSAQGPSLVGFGAFPLNWAIDWRLFFKMGPAPQTGPKRVQPAYKIDTSLVNPLGSLPASVASTVSSLPERNLIRGWRMQLPSGQAVARAMGLEPISDDKLKVGKANQDGVRQNRRLVDISPKFANNAPLWYYVLAEAQQQFVDNSTPIRLGQLGGTIVAETMVGLMLADSHAYIRQNPNFKPREAFCAANGKFGMAELLKAAQQA